MPDTFVFDGPNTRASIVTALPSFELHLIPSDNRLLTSRVYTPSYGRGRLVLVPPQNSPIERASFVVNNTEITLSPDKLKLTSNFEADSTTLPELVLRNNTEMPVELPGFQLGSGRFKITIDTDIPPKRDILTFKPAEEVRKKLNLSERELEVLIAVAKHQRAEDASEDLCISLNTTRTHLKNILIKLGVRSKQMAILVAISEGLNVRELLELNQPADNSLE